MNDGGPAFPVHPDAHKCSDAECAVLSGMSKREHFAVKAMQSLITKHAPHTHSTLEEARNCPTKALIIRGAVAYADALIAELAEQKPPKRRDS